MTEVIQKVQLVEGTFTPSEASDVISALITEKINFHKLQRLSKVEGNIHSDCNYPDGRVQELENEKIVAKEFISMARKEGSNLRINGILEISFE